MKGQVQFLIILLLVSVAIWISYLILSNQKIAESEKNILEIKYFGGVDGDAKEFKGFTLPFENGINYSVKETPIANNFVYVDFNLPSNTMLTAVAPGRVTNIYNSMNYNITYIYIKHPTANIYAVYVVANTSNLLVKVDDSINRGQNVAIVKIPFSINGTDAMLRLEVAGAFDNVSTSPFPVQLYLEKHSGYTYYWANDKPSYFAV
ncbi:MAG: peptidoglycan DD-metalloendopeptidase family protein [Candidatus Aenigmarchaeota archaeon]|nr:peptidoglycan DD-metalloendopeptidase family protein [Candidatus Aenigmarchaeota archaeon]